MAEISLEEMVKPYNLTPEELDAVKQANRDKEFDQNTLAQFVNNMRVDNAKKTASKNVADISFDELQVAFETVKDAKEGDELYDAKQKLLAKSEAVVDACSKAETINIDSAPELSEWLKINNSIGNENTKDRNASLETKLATTYQKYDEENGLSGITSKDAEKINTLNNELSDRYAGFNPFTVNDDSTLKYPEFANSYIFYENLTIQNTNKDVEEINKEQHFKNMMEIAKREAIMHLSKQKDFDKLPKDEQDKLFVSSMAQYMEEGVVSTIVASVTEKLSEEQNNNPQNREEIEKQAREAFKNISNNPKITISNSTAIGAYIARSQKQEILEKHIAQKTEKRSIWGKIQAKRKEFFEKYPKLKIVENIGLTMGINMVGGGIGLALYSAYRTCEAIRKANEEREKANSDKNLLSYIVSNPRHAVSIASSLTGVVLSGYSGSSSFDANGLFGQSIQHGAGQAMDNMGNTLSNFASNFSLSNIKETFSDGNLTSNMGEKLSGIRKAFSSESGLVFARTIRTTGTAVATFGLDIADMMKKENKGKRKKMFLAALAKVGLTSAAVYATTPVGDTVETNTDIPHPDSAINDDAVKGVETLRGTSPLKPEKTAEFKINTPWSSNEQTSENTTQSEIKVPYRAEEQEYKINTPWNNSEQGAENVSAPELSQETKFWNSRIDQFLGKTGELDEVKNHVYGMIDKGEIKLPEGIESKEEYLYKMTMAMEQRPDDLASTLGVDHKSSLQWEKDITSMKAEDFNKISQCFNDEYSDRGVYLGKEDSGVVRDANVAQKTQEIPPQTTVTELINENTQPKEDVISPVVQTEVRDEQYYQNMQDFVDGKGSANSLGKDLKDALGNNGDTVEKAIDRSMNTAVEEGRLTETQAEELGNVTKYVLDEKDNGEVNGKINDSELSKRELRQGMREVDKILEAKEEIANEVTMAENAVLTNETPEDAATTYSDDTKSSEFYKGMSSVIDKMQDGDVKLSEAMKEAIQNGELSQEQVMVMNTRYSELKSEGYTPEQALSKMEKDFDRAAKYAEAQEFAAGAKETTNAETQERLSEAKARVGVGAKGTETVTTQANSHGGQQPIRPISTRDGR